MGRPLEFFLHTCATVLTHCFNLINNYEIGVILVFHEDVFIVDLKCAMTRAGHALFLGLRACAFALLAEPFRAGAFVLFFGP